MCLQLIVLNTSRIGLNCLGLTPFSLNCLLNLLPVVYIYQWHDLKLIPIVTIFNFKHNTTYNIIIS